MPSIRIPPVNHTIVWCFAKNLEQKSLRTCKFALICSTLKGKAMRNRGDLEGASQQGRSTSDSRRGRVLTMYRTCGITKIPGTFS